jgi:hypothetical protein
MDTNLDAELEARSDAVQEIVNQLDQTPQRKLIGLCGRIGAGKTTFANLIRDAHPEFQTYILAEPLKKIGEILGFEKQELWGNQEQKMVPNQFWGITGRKFLQKLGTDIFRNMLTQIIPDMKIRHGIWIDLFLKAWHSSSANMIVEDVRFEDEVKVIQDLGGTIVWIDRPNNPNKEQNMLAHASEMLTPDKIKDVFLVTNRDNKWDFIKEVVRLFDHINFVPTSITKILSHTIYCDTEQCYFEYGKPGISWLECFYVGKKYPLHIELHGNPPVELLRDMQLDLCNVYLNSDCFNYLNILIQCQVNKLIFTWDDGTCYSKRIDILLNKFVKQGSTLILNMESWLEFYGYDTQSIRRAGGYKSLQYETITKMDEIIWDKTEHPETQNINYMDINEIVDDNGDTVFSYLGLLFEGCEIRQDDIYPYLFYVNKA